MSSSQTPAMNHTPFSSTNELAEALDDEDENNNNIMNIGSSFSSINNNDPNHPHHSHHVHIKGLSGHHRPLASPEIVSQFTHQNLHHSYNPDNPRTHRQLHLLEQMDPEITKYKKELRSIYDKYSSKDRKYLERGDFNHLEESKFIKFCMDYRISPSLLSLIELKEIFRLSTKKITHLDKHTHNEEKCTTFDDFIMCLVLLASKVFSGDKWDVKFPHNKQKFMLLLFWMDQKSEL